MMIWRFATAPDGSQWVSLHPKGTDPRHELWMPAYLWDDRPTEEGMWICPGCRHLSRLASVVMRRQLDDEEAPMCPGCGDEMLAHLPGSMRCHLGHENPAGPWNCPECTDHILANARWREWGDAPTDATEVLAYRPDAGVLLVMPFSHQRALLGARLEHLKGQVLMAMAGVGR